MDLRSMEVKTFAADAVIFCTGGIGAIFGRSTNSVVCTGAAQAALFQQDVDYANGEFIQVHPTAIPGEDKLRLMSESARGEGGRVWVPRNPAERSEEHTSELQSLTNLVCRLLLENKKKKKTSRMINK